MCACVKYSRPFNGATFVGLLRQFWTPLPVSWLPDNLANGQSFYVWVRSTQPRRRSYTRCVCSILCCLCVCVLYGSWVLVSSCTIRKLWNCLRIKRVKKSSFLVAKRHTKTTNRPAREPRANANPHRIVVFLWKSVRVYFNGAVRRHVGCDY